MGDGNGMHRETLRLEARLTLMAEMLQRAAEEARQLVDAYTEELLARGQIHPPSEGRSGDCDVD